MMDSTVGLNLLVLNMYLALGNISFSMGKEGDIRAVVLMKICPTSLFFSGLHRSLTVLLSSLRYSARDMRPWL